MSNIKGTTPKNPIVGRRYHVAGWKTGANFVLDEIDGETAKLSYPKRHWKKINVPVDRLRNTHRHRKAA